MCKKKKFCINVRNGIAFKRQFRWHGRRHGTYANWSVMTCSCYNSFELHFVTYCTKLHNIHMISNKQWLNHTIKVFEKTDSKRQKKATFSILLFYFIFLFEVELKHYILYAWVTPSLIYTCIEYNIILYLPLIYYKMIILIIAACMGNMTFADIFELLAT